ncbi:hypothetical protein [Roseivivax sp. CAU 1761]
MLADLARFCADLARLDWLCDPRALRAAAAALRLRHLSENLAADGRAGPGRTPRPPGDVELF